MMLFKKFTILLFFIFFSYFTVFSEELIESDLEGLSIAKIELSKNYSEYNEIQSKYGDLFLAYKLIPETYTFGNKEQRIIDYAYLFSEKDGVKILGYYSKYAVYDRYGEIIAKLGEEHHLYPKIVGIAENLFSAPFSVKFIIRNNEGLSKTNTFTLLEIDFSTDSLIKKEMGPDK